MASYPMVVPDVVLDRIRRYMKNPEEWVNRQIPVFDGKTPIQWVADGSGTWEQVLWSLERIFNYEVTA